SHPKNGVKVAKAKEKLDARFRPCKRTHATNRLERHSVAESPAAGPQPETAYLSGGTGGRPPTGPRPAQAPTRGARERSPERPPSDAGQYRAAHPRRGQGSRKDAPGAWEVGNTTQHRPALACPTHTTGVHPESQR